MKKRSVLLKLFFSTLYLSAFTFGGGYVIVTLMKKQFVDKYHWIEESERLDLIAIAQSTPGAIAVNGSMLSMEYGGDTECIAQATFLTTLVSIVTIPIIAAILL